MIDSKLLELLACPICEDRPALRLDGPRLVCDSCLCAFPIIEGIPHLLPENAEKIDGEKAEEEKKNDEPS